MQGELLSIETAQKVARYTKTIEYIKEELSALLILRDIDYYNIKLIEKEKTLKNILKKLEGINENTKN